ncbi:DOMON-like domain-containing protein [Altericroceibacterium endophyticum]|uniref:DOMON-like domain-containing protein n=1 Tax=Altericroceibacterium endophyticum TaxID=1808508 RepID=A0A6I4T0M2_9SPHN|nr:DOMON-like domain-containing protein [Altericroceibacterium endophyticum]MXO64446.1 hypothetical protein [Altericroceibacterium endophyticum]
MKTYHLKAHPAHDPISVSAVKAGFGIHPQGFLMLRYRIENAAQVKLPVGEARGRADGLWQTTCAELFLRYASGSYREFNFSPAGEWSAYDFSGYRSGRSDYDPLEWPEIDCLEADGALIITVILQGQELAGADAAGLSMVIEEEGGVKSYWALAQESAEPDFHNAACFAVPLRAASAS